MSKEIREDIFRGGGTMIKAYTVGMLALAAVVFWVAFAHGEETAPPFKYQIVAVVILDAVPIRVFRYGIPGQKIEFADILTCQKFLAEDADLALRLVELRASVAEQNGPKASVEIACAPFAGPEPPGQKV